MISNLYLVVFRLNDEAQNAKAATYLESISDSYWNELESVWFIKTDKQAVEIRDQLASLVHHDAPIVVAFLAGFAAWRGLDDQAEDWLAKHL